MGEKSVSCSGSDVYRDMLRRRVLIYGFTVSVIGFPVGVLLEMPVVWGLAIVGILIGGFKLWVRKNRAERRSSSAESDGTR